MSDKDMKLRLIVEAKNEADAALKGLRSDLDQTGRQADNLRGSMSLLNVAAKSLGAVLVGTVTVGAAAKIISLADAYTLAEGRLKLVTDSSTELASVQDQLFASAQRTRTEYLANVEGYARLAQNTKELNLEQKELLSINETLNKAFIISGATEAERSSTMIQLSQAFSAGVLRGEEFNSVAEQGSRVLQLLADYTGRSRGELRAMAEDGQLTADVLVQAILTGVRDVNEEFDKLPTTVEQAGNVLKNVLGALVNDANKGSGATAGLAREIIELASTIERNTDSILSLFSGIVEGADWAIQRVVNLTNAMRGIAAVKSGTLDFSDFAQMGPSDLSTWLSSYEQGVEKVHLRLTEARKELAALGEGGDMEQRQRLVIEITGLENTMRQAEELRTIQDDFNSSGLKLDDVSAREAVDRVRELNAQLSDAKRAKEAYTAAGLGENTEAVQRTTENIKKLQEELARAENAKKVLAASGFVFDGDQIDTVASKVKTLEERITEAKRAKEALEKAGFAPDSEAIKETARSLSSLEKQLVAVNDAASGTRRAHGLDTKALSDLRKEVLPTQVALEKYRTTVADIESAYAAGQFRNESEYHQALGNARKALNDATGATKAYNSALKEQEQVAKKARREAEQAAKRAASEAKAHQREYQAILDKLLPVEAAQREYNKSLAALDRMDPTHQTERYKSALANLDRQLAAVKKQAGEYAKAMEDAQRAAKESELTRQGTTIEIAIALGQMSENDALPFQIDLLEQRLRLQQELLADMQKSTPEEIAAWNSQAEAIARTTLELAEYQQRLRLLDPMEAFKQGLKDYSVEVDQEALDFYRDLLPDAIDTSSGAFAEFVRDVAQGNATLADAWQSLGEAIEDIAFDILQDLTEVMLKMAIMGAMESMFGGIFGGGTTQVQYGMTGGQTLGSVGVHHSGATLGVDPVSVTRTVPLASFMNAPRFHTGLKGNEFPAILEEGESVLTEGQMAAIGKGLSTKQSAPQVNMTIVEAPGVKAETETTTNNDGSLNVMVKMVEGAISDRMSRGQGLDKTMKGLYGARRRF
nr:tape measure protein [uncultured Desulfobulbus sp.]